MAVSSEKSYMCCRGSPMAFGPYTYSSLSVEGIIAFIFGCPKKDFDPGGKRWDPAVELEWRGRRY